MTVPQGGTNLLRAVVSAMVNADERASWKVPRPAEPAHQYVRLNYRCPHQIKTHGRYREEACLSLFYPPAGPRRLTKLSPEWPEYLAAGVSST